MFTPELAALQRRHGLSDTVMSEFHALLANAALPSDVATLIEEDHAVTLIPDPRAPTDDPTQDSGTHLETTASSDGRYGRYQDMGLLGMGGMAEVRRVRDRQLNRTMAMKIIHRDMAQHPGVMARFVEEAQCSAQLQHPGIVPVHELGQLPDGRVYFTMAEVKGRTLTEVIAEVHAVSSSQRWKTSSSGWTFRRLVAAFHRICEAVAYAHARGVVHRDLKPDNVMVGLHGEVLVVDWGLAKIRGHLSVAGDEDWVSTDRSKDEKHATRMGLVAGTPAYMPPEQARGEIDRIDARSDVYALGAILYELLGGNRPYSHTSGVAVLRKVLEGPPPDLGLSLVPESETFSSGIFTLPDPADRQLGPPIPQELLDACERAMSREMHHRFDDGRALATEIASWLDGAKRREQALAVVNAALEKAPEVQRLREQAATDRNTAEQMLSELKGWDPEQIKAPAWQIADRASEKQRQAAALARALEQALHGALTHSPDLPEAHMALAKQYRADHEKSELSRDIEASLRAEALLRTHASALPKRDPVRRATTAYLKGTGQLSLHTTPPGSEALLYRYTLQNRRMIPVYERSLGLTPLRKVAIEQGSYLLVLRHADCVDVQYPVHIDRQARWDAVPPSASAAQSVRLPGPKALAEDDCFVPAGWFLSGGDDDAPNSLPRQRLWCDDVIFKRYPVTNRQYLAFLDYLVARGREEEALEHVPRERGSTQKSVGAMLYGRAADGTFVLQPDADGDIWQLDWPVVHVDWYGATAYAKWFSRRTGQPWRLPGELEREKAARGVDGRFFPWGDTIDPSWCCYRESHHGAMEPALVQQFPVDRSVYGVCGLGGNTRDWCGDFYRPEGPLVDDSRVVLPTVTAPGIALGAHRAARGGAWGSGPRFSRAAVRNRSSPGNAVSFLGFRLARSW